MLAGAPPDQIASGERAHFMQLETGSKMTQATLEECIAFIRSQCMAASPLPDADKVHIILTSVTKLEG